MPSLKELRNRKKSVQATRKITSAMKLIAASKLRRAQEHAQAAHPYALMMSMMLRDLVGTATPIIMMPNLLAGTGQDKVHLLIAATSNRGLCGGFNASVIRRVRYIIQEEEKRQRKVKIICIGRKGYDQLKRNYADSIVATFEAFDKPAFSDASAIAKHVLGMFERNEFDLCTIVYNKFVTALTQKVTEHRLIPYAPFDSSFDISSQTERLLSPYEYEPPKIQVLEQLLPQNLAVQIFRVLLESIASEQGARMAAMDGATRNAEEMIQALDLTYNRTRQAFITKELIEIVSGAEAL